MVLIGEVVPTVSLITGYLSVKPLTNILVGGTYRASNDGCASLQRFFLGDRAGMAVTASPVQLSTYFGRAQKFMYYLHNS